MRRLRLHDSQKPSAFARVLRAALYSKKPYGTSIMKKLISFIAICTLFFCNLSYAETYGSIPDKFFAYIKQGKPNEAIDYVYGTNSWMSKNSDQIVNLKNQLSQVNKLVGTYLFHELIVEEKAGTRYVHLIYLVGYERQPLRFELKLYKPAEEWRFFGVSFDSDLTEEIEKQANQQLIRK
jgi:hypothetical protein